MDIRGKGILGTRTKFSDMLSKLILPLLLVFCVACKEKILQDNLPKQISPEASNKENVYPKIINIPLPEGYQRTKYSPDSFAAWLRNINLKKDKTVYKFNGTSKNNQTAQFAVLNVSVGKQNLQQCADAVMRLRAEYLFSKKEYNNIIFTDNNNTSYHFSQPYTRNHFDAYLLQVFGMCGTASLAKQLKPNIKMEDIEPGDVLIRGGFPGHAVIAMDVAINQKGKKVYLLAQSYMPAQDIHVFLNPSNTTLSPWYEVNDKTIIETPEYTFTKFELKRW